jgi:DNA-binding NtrC family response regulator
MLGGKRVGHSGRLFDHSDCFSIQCVFLTCFDNDYRVVSSLLGYGGVRIHRAETLDQADFILTVTGGTVVLTDCLFLDGTWEDAIEMCAHVHPTVSSLVIADPADRDFVEDATDRGAFGIFWRPLPMLRLRKLIEGAHEAAVRRRQAPEAIFA